METKNSINDAIFTKVLWSWFTPKLIWDKEYYGWNKFYRLKLSSMFQWTLDLLWKYATHKVVIGFMWVISFAVDIIKLHFGWHYLNKMEWTVVLFANFQPVCFSANSLNLNWKWQCTNCSTSQMKLIKKWTKNRFLLCNNPS